MAISSVSAVLWTGGLIARQLTNYIDVQFRAALEFIGFGFFTPMLALFVTGNTLRIAAGTFLCIYLVVARKIYQNTEGVESGQIAPPTTVAHDFIPQYEKNLWTYFYLNVLSVAAISVIVVLPFDQAVAWTSFLIDFIGYQILTGKVFALQQDVPVSSSLLLIHQKVSGIDDRLKTLIHIEGENQAIPPQLPAEGHGP